MNSEISFREKDVLVMKLLHYFITEQGYNPIILRGVTDEIWLENMDAPYKIVRINTGYIHNEEQFDFDIFKTKKIMSKIKLKTFSLRMNALSLFLDLGDSVVLKSNENINCIQIKDESDFVVSDQEKEEALKQVDQDYIRILERTKKQITEFHKNQIDKSWSLYKDNGVIMGQMVRPIKRVALYVPGGTAAYPSTVLMNAIPAKLLITNAAAVPARTVSPCWFINSFMLHPPCYKLLSTFNTSASPPMTGRNNAIYTSVSPFCLIKFSINLHIPFPCVSDPLLKLEFYNDRSS